ncbi:MAG TPA: hypothetical protein PKZ32_08825 [Candidatus Melainabacteria bacterium]|nr:hypothetical protein [Candidatus Melainabacteria bacterium]
MTLNHKLASLLLAVSFGSAAIAMPALAENAPTVPLTMEEIQAKRREARETLMVPSLEGIRGIAYRVVGYKNYEPLENELGGILKETGVPLFVATKLKPGDAPVDAILQITFYKTASHTIAELSVRQWVSLMRDPKTKVQAVTYSDKVFMAAREPKEAVTKLAQDFTRDFMKANSGKSTASKGDKREAADGKKPKKSAKK